MDKAKLTEIVEGYGMKPCRDFVSTLGPDVFEPEVYLYIGSFNHLKLEDEEFYGNWIRYNVCKIYLENEDKLLKGIKDTADNA